MKMVKILLITSSSLSSAQSKKKNENGISVVQMKISIKLFIMTTLDFPVSVFLFSKSVNFWINIPNKLLLISINIPKPNETRRSYESPSSRSDEILQNNDMMA